MLVCKNGSYFALSVESHLLFFILLFPTGNNRLTGVIPSELGNIVTLKELHLHSNELVGSLPVEITSISGLLVLNLDTNQLTGSISVQSAFNRAHDSAMQLSWRFESIETLFLCK